MKKLTGFLAFFFFSCFSLIASASSSTNYLGVIDAGSTGSRFHVYRYERDANQDPINIQEIWVNRLKPGFATVATNESGMDEYMQKLTGDCPYQQLPVYFYATGGMRFQSDADQNKGYSLLKKWFTQKPQFVLKSVRTIPGKEEALYDWLAMNYHEGTLANPSDWVGVLDIGGASAQITFPVKNTRGINKQDQQNIKIYGQNVTLFTHSFLGLGESEVTHQYLDDASCFPRGFSLPSGDVGAGDAQHCSTSMRKLVNGVHAADSYRSTIAGANVHKWFLIGGPIYSLNSAYFSEQNNNRINVSHLLQSAQQKVCSQNWSDLRNQNISSAYVSNYCLLPTYYYTLMVNGFGLSSQANVNVGSLEQEIDWTIGVVLAQGR